MPVAGTSNGVNSASHPLEKDLGAAATAAKCQARTLRLGRTADRMTRLRLPFTAALMKRAGIQAAAGVTGQWDNCSEMRLSDQTLDDLLRKLFPKLLSSRIDISASRGHARELFGVLLELNHPRARLSRSETRGRPFSCLGEFLWYLSRDNKLDFIRYYIPAYEKETEDGETIYGAYGPRLFDQRGHDQLRNVINLLRSHPELRRAVIQLFNAEDIARRYKEVPCTCTLQFLVRRKRLHMLTTMRSNDAYKGLPHDIFCFTMLQEVVARTLGLELGKVHALCRKLAPL